MAGRARAGYCDYGKSVLPLSMRVAGIRSDTVTTLELLPLERIKVPTLIITARDDLFKTLPAAGFMAERIPGAKLIVLDRGGHFFVSRQRQLNDAIAEFLPGIENDAKGTEPS